MTTLDTSGTVYDDGTRPTGTWKAYGWTDLDAFTQEYVEALLAALNARLWTNATATSGAFAAQGFSDLSPEALEMIRADCAESRRAHFLGDKITGAQFWEKRQVGNFGRFPPLTVTLGDDGKVYLSSIQRAETGR